MPKLTKNQIRMNSIRDLLAKTPVDVKNYYSWETGFLKSIEQRLQSGKVLTANQRTRLDSLLQEGYAELPIVDNELITTIDSVLANSTNLLKFEWENQILQDFKTKLLKSYTLSEKQVQLIKRIETQVQEAVDNAIFITPPLLKRCQLVVDASKLYISLQGKKLGAVNKIKFCVERMDQTITMKELEAAEEAVKGNLTALTNPRFKSGDLAYLRGKPALVVSDQYISRSEGRRGTIYRLVNDVLKDGTIHTVTSDNISKRGK